MAGLILIWVSVFVLFIKMEKSSQSDSNNIGSLLIYRYSCGVEF